MKYKYIHKQGNNNIYNYYYFHNFEMLAF